jgi:hypothetical protein
MKNTYPNAETRDPIETIGKLSVGTHNILSQAPDKVSAAPNIIYTSIA